MSTKPNQYNHAEAFCLMWYRCDKCCHIERVWNSRDGVTPFCCTCTKCGTGGLEGGMKHVNWRMDYCNPGHKLEPGQYFWRDGTPEEAAEIMTKRLDRCIGTPYEVDEARRAELIELSMDESDGEFGRGWPIMDRAQIPDKKTKKVLLIKGEADIRHIKEIEGLAAKKGISLEISEVERVIDPMMEIVLEAAEADIDTGVKVGTSSGKRRHKLKGRNRRGW